MDILIYQLDGKIPNLAVMNIAAHHRKLGHKVEVRWTQKVQWQLNEKPDVVYASAIFTKSQPIITELLKYYPAVIIGGTGSGNQATLQDYGITSVRPDYSDYPNELRSIGFTQRGCRLRCKFCVVPSKEGRPVIAQTPTEIWRGGDYPKQLLLLDNDFFGQPNWEAPADEIINGGYKVCITQGINARLLTSPQAVALAGMDYRDTKIQKKRVYTAWDKTSDQKKFMRGVELLIQNGIKPDHIMVYLLVGFDSGIDDARCRVSLLMEMGIKPYPMPYIRTREYVGFQRWVIKRYNKVVAWEQFKAANYDPRNLQGKTELPLIEGGE